MSRKTLEATTTIIHIRDPLECPFREFRDNELHADAWGLGTAAFKTLQHTVSVKTTTKESGQRSGASTQSPKLSTPTSGLWVDDQTQPLPRSVRQYLHGWIRAEDLAMDRWGAELTIYEENDSGKMALIDMQLCHAQVLFRSSFCRKVLSACYLLERVDLPVEHQWESFICVPPPEGWRAKYHIYSPGLKAGGGPQHKPILSKNGCYLVRLFYLGAWRCVWVNDQVPVDTSGAPLLPFSPLLTHPPAKPGSTRVPPAITAGVIYLWPLLITKALLKLAAPDMNSDEDTDDVEDEPMPEFDIFHALTGSMNVRYIPSKRSDEIWTRIITEVPVFSWDDDEDGSTIKTKSTRKPTAKELASVVKHHTAMTYAILKDTKEYPPYHLPGITPGHEMTLLITMARDVPLKKPLPEPEVALWKYYRWVDWARSHGLYAAYDCPRDKFIKVNGLLKSSYAPHLLDVQSTESITMGFIEEHVKSTQQNEKDDEEVRKKKKKEVAKTQIQQALVYSQQVKVELREWIRYATFFKLLDCIRVVYHPSLFNFTSAASSPPIRITKSASTKLPHVTDVAAPKYGPLYLQLDGPEMNKLRISFATLHPRILFNSGSPIDEFIEPGHLVLERFEWFNDTAIPVQKAFLTTRGYDALEVDFNPGRHFFRIWTHYRINWHMMLISESSLLLSTRDVIQCAAVRECPWSSRFLLNLGTAFSNWIKISRASSQTTILADREFFRSYLPDLPWDDEVVGYDRHLLHWMFRQALQSLLSKTLGQIEWKAVSHILRKYFCDPDFGFPNKPPPPRSFREIVNLEVCDCLMPEMEEIEFMEEQVPEVTGDHDINLSGEHAIEEKPLVAQEVMDKLLRAPVPPVASQICEMATEELHCAILKEEREKMIKKHEAAIVLQAHWRGTWARKVLAANIVFTPEVTKYVMDRAFGSLEALSMLMNEFFLVWPGTKRAYSVASALSGVYGLQQHIGTTTVTSKCNWIPYFQGVFYCHAPVKVHFDVQSSVSHSTVEVYNNDTGKQLPQVYNTHITFDIVPNNLGYTVLGHGTLAQVSGINYDAHWQLTIMSCLNGAFHLCDNEEFCKELPLPRSSKLHLDEVFLPNRRNILGGIRILVTQHQAVSFRAAASSCDLEMVATLRSTIPGPSGCTEELATCSGKGQIHWPYIRLEPTASHRKSLWTSSSRDIPVLNARSLLKTQRAVKSTSKPRSNSKLRLAAIEPRVYSIEVTCPMGWPITLDQWKRVDEVRNSTETLQLLYHPVIKKGIGKEKEKPGKPGSAKDKIEKVALLPVQQPMPGDACVELECALAVGGGAVARRDDERDLMFAAARKSWATSEPGRNQKGAQIRKDFRADFLVVPPPPPGFSSSETDTTGSTGTAIDEAVMFENTEAEATEVPDVQRPTPVSETDMVEMNVEEEEEARYLLMPEQLRDKFIALDFLPFCMKERNEEETVLISPDMSEAGKTNRHARIEAAMERMRELQLFNEQHVIGRQKIRCKLLEKLFVDATLKPELVEVMQLKDDAIAQELNLRSLSATKKKLDAKKK